MDMRKHISICATATFESGSRRLGELRASAKQSTRGIFNISRALSPHLSTKKSRRNGVSSPNLSLFRKRRVLKRINVQGENILISALKRGSSREPLSFALSLSLLLLTYPSCRRTCGL